jgi:hypothetical protein
VKLDWSIVIKFMHQLLGGDERSLRLSIPALRPFEAEVLAQGAAFVFRAEQAAALQLGNDQGNKFVERAWQVRRQRVRDIVTSPRRTNRRY